MSTIDLQQQSIEGDVSEETKTVKIPGRIGGYLHHASIDLNWWYTIPKRHDIRTLLKYFWFKNWSEFFLFILTEYVPLKKINSS